MRKYLAVFALFLCPCMPPAAESAKSVPATSVSPSEALNEKNRQERERTVTREEMLQDGYSAYGWCNS